LDIADTGTTNGNKRLSWHLDQQGGYRVGNICVGNNINNNSSDWERLIFWADGIPPEIIELGDAIKKRNRARLAAVLPRCPPGVDPSLVKRGEQLLDRLTMEAVHEKNVLQAIASGSRPALRYALADLSGLGGGLPARLTRLQTQVQSLLEKNDRVFKVLLGRTLGLAVGDVERLLHPMHEKHCDTLINLAARLHHAETCSCEGDRHVPLSLQAYETACLTDAVQAIKLECKREVDVVTAEERTIQESMEPKLAEKAQCQEVLARAKTELVEAKTRLKLAQQQRATALKRDCSVAKEIEQYDAARLVCNALKQACVARFQCSHTLDERLVASKIATQDAWEAWQDTIASSNALENLDDNGGLGNLLANLGYCEWTAAFETRGLTLEVLPSLGEAMLCDAVKNSGKNTFGSVRRFNLAIQQIQRGDGLPQWCAPGGDVSASVSQPRPVQIWTPEEASAHLEKSEASAAAAVVAQLGVSGDVLLSLTQDDFVRELGLRDIALWRRLETCITQLQQQQIEGSSSDAVVAASKDVVDALRGGDPCQFPISFLRKCTNGFMEARVEGEGAFGKVYRAVDPVSGVRFAIKRINHEGLVSSQEREVAKESMRRELDVLLKIQHPHMIRLLGHCTTGTLGDASGELCLMYELGSFGSLADNLAQDDRAKLLTPKVRVRILCAIASVLNYLHRSHQPPVFHRDVKSANIVLCEGFRPKLIDCGLAKLLTDEQTEAKAKGKSIFTMGASAKGALGTPAYSCPKYLQNQKYGERSELYSFGVVALEVIVGKLTQHVDGLLQNYYLDPDPEERTQELTLTEFDKRTGPWPEVFAEPLISVAKTSIKSHSKRPKSFQPVLTNLKTLERLHCQATVEELSSHLLSVEEASLAVMAERREEQRQKMQDALLEKQRQSQALEAAKRTCCICFDDEVLAAEGVECGSESENEKHFLCDGCFERHVQEEAQKELCDVGKRDAQVFCPHRKKYNGAWSCVCTTPYSESTVAGHTSEAVFCIYLDCKRRLEEHRLVREMEQEFEARFERERTRIATLKEEELRVEQTCRHIQERILTLKCPRCAAAFLDFEGCFALTCHRCRCGFCAYCLADCGNDAHAHVARCPHNRRNREVFGRDEDFQAAQHQRRERMLQEYLATVDVFIRAKVVGACRRYFEDLGMRVPN
jgi:serine/threonine protein kinase